MQHTNTPSTRINFLYIAKKVNIFEYPTEVDRHHPNDEITVGDMHGDFVKDVYYGLRNGVISLRNGVTSLAAEDYARLVEIYRKGSGQFTVQELASVEQILDGCKKELPLLYRTIGDTKGDRGESDLLMEMFDNKKDQLQVNYRNLFSNHDLEYIYWYENEYDRPHDPYIYGAFTRSLDNYDAFVKAQEKNPEPAHLERIKQLNEQRASFYKAHLYLTDYTLNPDQQSATFYTHAVTGLDILQMNAANLLPDQYNQYTKEDDSFTQKSAPELARVIDEVNAEFQTQVMQNNIHYLCPTGSKQKLYVLDENKENSLLFTAANRSFAEQFVCPPQFTFVHGHYKIVDPMPSNVYCLDNNLGLLLNLPAEVYTEYTVLISLSPESQQLENKDAAIAQWDTRKKGETPSFDLLKAITILAAQGNVELQYQLACYYYEELDLVPRFDYYKKQEFTYTNYRSEAARWLQFAANHGHRAAKFHLANYLTMEKREAAYFGIKSNVDLALAYYSELLTEEADIYLSKIEAQAEQGDLPAIQALMNYYDDASSPNYTLYQHILAAEQNDLEALQYCIDHLEGKRAGHYLDKKANLDDFDALFLRAQSYYEGNARFAIEPDLDKSLRDIVNLISKYTDKPDSMEQVTAYLMAKPDLYEKFIKERQNFIFNVIKFVETSPKMNGGNNQNKKGILNWFQDLSRRDFLNAVTAIADYVEENKEKEEGEKEEPLNPEKPLAGSMKMGITSFTPAPDSIPAQTKEKFAPPVNPYALGATSSFERSGSSGPGGRCNLS